jgi:hypothetical protein
LINLGAVLLLNRTIRDWIRDLKQSIDAVWRDWKPDIQSRWIISILLGMLGLALLLTLAPPTHWDTLTYHLEGPRSYLREGRIAPLSDNHFLGFPQTLEMLYLWLVILAGPRAPALLHWCFGVLAMLLVAGIARRFKQPQAGLIAIVSFLVCESAWAQFGFAYNDLGATAFVTGAAACLIAWDGNHRLKLLMLAGVFVGLAMGTKYTSAGAAIGAGMLTIWLARRHGIWHSVRALGIVTSAAVIVFLPWLIKDAVLYGNPIAPFIWGTSGFDSLDQFYYLRPGTGLEAIELVLAPIQGTIFGRDGLAPYGSTAGPLIVTLVPLVAFGWRRRPAEQQMLVSGLIVFVMPAYFVWLAGAATSWFLVQTRLLYPLFPLAGLLGGIGVVHLASINIQLNPGRIANLAIMLATVCSGVRYAIVTVRANPVPVALGLVSEADYLRESLGTYFLAMERINGLPDNARIQFLWEPRTYYCLRDCVPDSMINQWWHDRRVMGDPETIVAHWRNDGVTHILIFESGYRFLRDEEPHESMNDSDIEALDWVRKNEMTLVWAAGDSFSLYELKQ